MYDSTSMITTTVNTVLHCMHAMGFVTVVHTRLPVVVVVVLVLVLVTGDIGKHHRLYEYLIFLPLCIDALPCVCVYVYMCRRRRHAPGDSFCWPIPRRAVPLPALRARPPWTRSAPFATRSSSLPWGLAVVTPFARYVHSSTFYVAPFPRYVLYLRVYLLSCLCCNLRVHLFIVHLMLGSVSHLARYICTYVCTYVCTYIRTYVNMYNTCI